MMSASSSALTAPILLSSRSTESVRIWLILTHESGETMEMLTLK